MVTRPTHPAAMQLCCKQCLQLALRGQLKRQRLRPLPKEKRTKFVRSGTSESDPSRPFAVHACRAAIGGRPDQRRHWLQLASNYPNRTSDQNEAVGAELARLLGAEGMLARPPETERFQSLE